MRSAYRGLRLKQLDRSLEPFQAARVVSRPQKGWIRAIREAMGVSAGELGRILGSSRQLPLQLEKAEADDRITLKSLRKAADALEGIVADDHWPLPTYQEMLFIMLISVREQTAYATSTRRSQAPR